MSSSHQSNRQRLEEGVKEGQREESTKVTGFLENPDERVKPEDVDMSSSSTETLDSWAKFIVLAVFIFVEMWRAALGRRAITRMQIPTAVQLGQDFCSILACLTLAFIGDLVNAHRRRKREQAGLSGKEKTVVTGIPVPSPKAKPALSLESQTRESQQQLLEDERPLLGGESSPTEDCRNPANTEEDDERTSVFPVSVVPGDLKRTSDASNKINPLTTPAPVDPHVVETPTTAAVEGEGEEMSYVRQCLNPTEILFFLPVACCYGPAESIGKITPLFLSAGVASILKRLRLPLNMLGARLVFGRKYGPTRWMAMLGMVSATVLFGLQGSSSAMSGSQESQGRAKSGAKGGDYDGGNAVSRFFSETLQISPALMVGFLLILVNSFLIVMGNLQFEYKCKKGTKASQAPFYVVACQSFIGQTVLTATLLLLFPYFGIAVDHVHKSLDNKSSGDGGEEDGGKSAATISEQASFSTFRTKLHLASDWESKLQTLLTAPRLSDQISQEEVGNNTRLRDLHQAAERHGKGNIRSEDEVELGQYLYQRSMLTPLPGSKEEKPWELFSPSYRRRFEELKLSKHLRVLEGKYRNTVKSISQSPFKQDVKFHSPEVFENYLSIGGGEYLVASGNNPASASDRDYDVEISWQQLIRVVPGGTAVDEPGRYDATTEGDGWRRFLDIRGRYKRVGSETEKERQQNGFLAQIQSNSADRKGPVYFREKAADLSPTNTTEIALFQYLDSHIPFHEDKLEHSYDRYRAVLAEGNWYVAGKFPTGVVGEPKMDIYHLVLTTMDDVTPEGHKASYDDREALKQILGCKPGSCSTLSVDLPVLSIGEKTTHPEIGQNMTAVRRRANIFTSLSFHRGKFAPGIPLDNKNSVFCCDAVRCDPRLTAGFPYLQGEGRAGVLFRDWFGVETLFADKKQARVVDNAVWFVGSVPRLTPTKSSLNSQPALASQQQKLTSIYFPPRSFFTGWTPNLWLLILVSSFLSNMLQVCVVRWLSSLYKSIGAAIATVGTFWVSDCYLDFPAEGMTVEDLEVTAKIPLSILILCLVLIFAIAKEETGKGEKKKL